MICGMPSHIQAQDIFGNLVDTCFEGDSCGLTTDSTVGSGEFPADIYLNGNYAAEQQSVKVDEDGILRISHEALVNAGVLDRYKDSNELKVAPFYKAADIEGFDASINGRNLQVHTEIALEFRTEQLFLPKNSFDLTEITLPSPGAHMQYRLSATAGEGLDPVVSYSLDPTLQLGLSFLRAGFSGRTGFDSKTAESHSLGYFYADRILKKQKLRARSGLFRPDSQCWLWGCQRRPIVGASLQSLGLEYANVTLNNGFVYTGFTSEPGTIVELVVDGIVIDRFTIYGGQ
jgi:hypothetical protein